MHIERDNIPELNIEPMDDSENSLILLEQDSGGNTDRIAIHRVQLRYMAEKFGLIESSDPQAAKTIATLQRRLLVLRERIESLHDFLCNHSDHKHADLSWETTFTTATLDIANEFCHGLDAAPAECNPATGDATASKQQSIKF